MAVHCLSVFLQCMNCRCFNNCSCHAVKNQRAFQKSVLTRPRYSVRYKRLVPCVVYYCKRRTRMSFSSSHSSNATLPSRASQPRAAYISFSLSFGYFFYLFDAENLCFVKSVPSHSCPSADSFCVHFLEMLICYT